MDDLFPVLPFRSTLYSPDELFAGFRADDPTSYAATPDLRAYRSTRLPPNREVGMLRALHDQCMTEARDELIDDRRVVAIMGGHALARSDPSYRAVARMAARLTGRGDLVASGGGPGAMEATHLGALLSPGGPDALDAALDVLGVEAGFPVGMAHLVGPDATVDADLLQILHRWQAPAFAVLDAVPADERGPSLAIPTWFYGHEPPTPFASHIAKYFSNSLREDGLLAIACDGVVYAPGWAGTLQEVFQDAAQNVYRTFHARFSPMAFLDTAGCWSERFPVGPLLETLFGVDDFRRYVCISEDPDEIVAFLAEAR